MTAITTDLYHGGHKVNVEDRGRLADPGQLIRFYMRAGGPELSKGLLNVSG